MKNIIMTVSEQLSEETKKQLSEEVKETIAPEAIVRNRKFTASEMWNRDRKRRSASTMMRKWNLN